MLPLCSTHSLASHLLRVKFRKLTITYGALDDAASPVLLSFHVPPLTGPRMCTLPPPSPPKPSLPLHPVGKAACSYLRAFVLGGSLCLKHLPQVSAWLTLHPFRSP